MDSINTRDEAEVQLSHLEAFVSVCRLGSLGRAADALSLTQPAVTARIRGLELELGAELFVRTPRGMRLTDVGRSFLPHVERALAAIAEAQQMVSDVRSGVAGEVLIAATPAMSTYVLPTILMRLQAEHPDVNLGVRTAHTDAVCEMVVRGDVHVGIGRPIQHPDVTSVQVFMDEIVLVVHANHPFAKERRVRMSELADERLILFDRLSTYHELTSSLFRNARVVPRSVMEMDNVEAAKKMVQLGLGVALLPRMALTEEFRSGSLRAVHISRVRKLSQPVMAMRRRDAGRATGALSDFLTLLGATKPFGA